MDSCRHFIAWNASIELAVEASCKISGIWTRWVGCILTLLCYSYNACMHVAKRGLILHLWIACSPSLLQLNQQPSPMSFIRSYCSLESPVLSFLKLIWWDDTPSRQRWNWIAEMTKLRKRSQQLYNALMKAANRDQQMSGATTQQATH